MTRSTLLIPVLCLLVGGCGDDGGSADGADAMTNNPPNPNGLGPAPVDLGAAETFALVAKTGITNVTGSAITGGDVGLSPAAASFITGFALAQDASLVFATSIVVTPPGRVYASDYGVPTPTNLTTVVLDVEAAYTDAASRTNPDFLNLASGEIGGETLAPGLYRWGTGVTIPDDVTIAGGAEDVWIFQISNDLDLSTGTDVLLTGGALPENVFWQVAGEVTIHANAHFEGIVLGQTGITLQTDASLDGRLFAQSLIALDDNAITAP